MIKTEDAFGKTMETIIWLCKKQNTDKNNHGSWSMESDLRKLFITTNQVACTLIDLQISINDESIIFATRWVEKQLQNDLIPIQDRANALELFSLIKQKEKINKILPEIKECIRNKDWTTKKLFPLMMLHFSYEYNIPLDDDCKKNLIEEVRYGIENLHDYNIAELSYLLYIVDKHKINGIEPGFIEKAKERLIERWGPQYRRSHEGWSASITENAYIANNILNSKLIDENKLKEQYRP